MTSIAIYNDPATGYAKKYTYRQDVIDRLKLLDAYAGMTDAQVFEAQCTGKIAVEFSIVDDSTLPADLYFSFSSYDHDLSSFTEDSAKKTEVVDAMISSYLETLETVGVATEFDADATDCASVAQLKTLKSGQLEVRCHYCHSLAAEPDMEIYDYLYRSAVAWLEIVSPVIADLEAMPVYREFVITDNCTDGASVTTTNATDSANRLVTEIEEFMMFFASIHGFRDCMYRDIQAASTTAALIAIDTMDIITHAEGL